MVFRGFQKECNARTSSKRLKCKTSGKSYHTTFYDYNKNVKAGNYTSFARQWDKSLRCISTCINQKLIRIFVLPGSVYFDEKNFHLHAFAMLDN